MKNAFILVLFGMFLAFAGSTLNMAPQFSDQETVMAVDNDVGSIQVEIPSVDEAGLDFLSLVGLHELSPVVKAERFAIVTWNDPGSQIYSDGEIQARCNSPPYDNQLTLFNKRT